MTSTSLESTAPLQSGPRSLNPFKNGYTTTISVLTLALLTAFPICSYAVFVVGTDRTATASGLSFAYCIIMTSLFVAPWLPFSALKGETN
jgi:hypothetical protein